MTPPNVRRAHKPASFDVVEMLLDQVTQVRFVAETWQRSTVTKWSEPHHLLLLGLELVLREDAGVD